MHHNNLEKASKNNQGIEHQGTKQKFWYGKNQDKLFKIGKHRGENWAEIVAFHLATLLSIPCAKYKPGFLQEEPQIKGVISQSFIDKKKGERLINANELLAKLIKNYDSNKTYKQRDYTFFSSMALIRLLTPQLTGNPIKQFIGYLIFDIWIANQDRHHENWGFVTTDTELFLAPSFDHASSMGCRDSENKKELRLNTKDLRYSVETFAKKAKTAMYKDSKILKTYELAELCWEDYPEEYSFWVNKINKISAESINKCFDLLPPSWMSNIDKKFTIELLKVNQNFLNKLCVKN
jgi:hypothetical protein